MSTSVSRGVDTNNQTVPQNPRQYSQVVQTNMFPKREQAIVLNVNENLQLIDYITAVGNLCEPKNILFASRISNGRICIYLSSIKLVEDLVNTHETIQIDNYNIGIRRLISPAKRLLLSNVVPSIPHYILENSIKSLGYKTTSPVSFLRIGTRNPLFSHVLSFRRQVYVLPNEEVELPSSIEVTYEDVTYRIFLTFDVISCFLCKDTGHTANQCPQQNPKDNTEDMEISNEVTAIIDNQSNTNKQKQLSEQSPVQNKNSPILDISSAQSQDQNPPTIDITNPFQSQNQSPLELGTKRPASPSAPSTASADEQNTKHLELTNETVFRKPKSAPKKLKKSTSEENINISDLLNPVEQHITEKTPPYVLTHTQLVDLFENLPGSEPISLIKSYTEDLPALLDMLHKIYPLLAQKSIKNRNTRLQKKIKEYLKLSTANTDGYDSECSQSSQSSY